MSGVPSGARLSAAKAYSDGSGQYGTDCSRHALIGMIRAKAVSDCNLSLFAEVIAEISVSVVKATDKFVIAAYTSSTVLDPGSLNGSGNQATVSVVRMARVATLCFIPCNVPLMPDRDRIRVCKEVELVAMQTLVRRDRLVSCARPKEIDGDVGLQDELVPEIDWTRDVGRTQHGNEVVRLAR